MAIDWTDPAARARLIESVGPKEYNRLHEEHRRSTVIETVNGHAIRPIATGFGRLFEVGATGRAFPSLEAAKNFAITEGKTNG
jgi:hypothetical protein